MARSSSDRAQNRRIKRLEEEVRSSQEKLDELEDERSHTRRATDLPKPWPTRRGFNTAVVEILRVGLSGGIVAAVSQVTTSVSEDLKVLYRDWWSCLDIGRADVVPGDDHSLYPVSNPLHSMGMRRDARAMEMIHAMVAFSSSQGGARLSVGLPEDVLPTTKAATRDLILVGSSINNRATRLMLGTPMQDRAAPRTRFESIDRTWHADLKVIQYTPPDAREIHAKYGNLPWSFWDHECLIQGEGRFRSHFSCTDKEPCSQIDCYFHITRLESPRGAPREQVVLYIAGLHTLGTKASEQLFEPRLDTTAQKFVRSLSHQALSYPSWQAVARASHFKDDGGKMRAGKISLEKFFPIDTRLS